MFGTLSYKKQKRLIIFSFLLIPVALLLLFTYYPAAKLVYFSFTNWDGYSPEKPWVGLDNYREVFSNPDIFGVFAHNFAYFVMGLIQNVIAIYFAVILNSRLRGRNMFRLLLFLPYIMNGVAVAFMFGYVFDTTQGSLNLFLNSIGLTGLGETSWLGTEGLVNYSLASTGLWRFMGYNMVIYIASLQAIPSDIYEAAKIDGANAWQTFWRMTLPNMKPVIQLNLFLTVTGALEVFDLPFVLTKGGPAGASQTYVQRVVETAFAYNNYGLASAMSIILLFFVVAVVALQQFVLSRGGGSK
ncbi:sugar ABC transporter permease [Paenibacillus sp. alder61]|uniref:Sugar ABC transporter permease n=1 Tax=Paenibacillus faecis TaxID=862114 RepID=A0A5D0CNY1_9BACL|nr:MULTISPECIES: sugar ABC transporter permease [Paenibacillus]MCA1294862.1 sugar ABC transporter permease [Paenibacillus sp. alder61]TYA11422.1 sugar ABC transporter permease [Paenibacillus faecis]